MKKLFTATNIKAFLSVLCIYFLGIVLIYETIVYLPFCSDLIYAFDEKSCSSFIWHSIAGNLILLFVTMLCVFVVRFFLKKMLRAWISIIPVLYFSYMAQYHLSIDAMKMGAIGFGSIVNRSGMPVSTVNAIIVSVWGTSLFLVYLYSKRKNRNSD